MGKLAREIITVCMLAIGVVATALRAGGTDEISDAVAGISTEAVAVSSATTLLSHDISDLLAKYRMTNAGSCALLIMGQGAGNFAPVYFIPGPTGAVTFQADLIVGPGITVTGITAGPAATLAQKSIASSPISGGERFIVFGLNQNTVGLGNVANVSFDLTGASAGSHILALTNFVASDASGNDVPLCVTSGVISK